ncbi:hydroxyacid dehydrogenase [Roseomonas gilardii subsp. gilardii]|uniref:hydroxyacid dehydrogenase n=1 Tax=Roseomonas gilardii TaxID=257708 RepID=UPI001FF8D356|nr:hydroxyacid dehydrogenase [Roseomonas gilardii]UPG74036.1 hydroxyacid dehydrogenase [Roseomonas gilardii subsp. gilardii]
MSGPAALLAYDPGRNPETVSMAQHAALREMLDVLRPDPLQGFDDPALAPLLPRVEVLVTGWGAPRLDRAALEAMPRLRLVAHLAGTVKGHLAPEVWERGIRVVNAADANALPVAEYTLAAILFANKQVFRLNRLYRERRDAPKPWSNLAPGLGNYGRSVGIVGASRIGRRVIELLRPFDLQVLLHDPFVSGEEAARLGVTLLPLEELLSRADLVSLHAPLLPATRGMIGRRQLALMRDGAALVNTARGGLVDQDALVEELRSGRISAVIDVTEPDLLPPEHPLYDLPNVFLTPHIAGAEGPETQRMTALVIEEIRRFLSGEPLRHEVRAQDLPSLA